MNLFSGNCYRLIHGKLCYLLIWGFLMLLGLNFCNAHQSYGSMQPILENHFFSFTNLNLVCMGIFGPLFLGVEYSNGVLKNKLITGHTRTEIYLANLLTFLLFGTILTFSAVLMGFSFGFSLFGEFRSASSANILLYSLLALTTTWASGALYTLCTMLITNHNRATALCILLAFGMILLGQFLYVELSQPKIQQAVFYTNSGEAFVVEQPNPQYLTGFKRQVYQFFCDFTPGGQSYQIMRIAALVPLRLLGYSVIFFALTTGVGLVLFQHKDIK